MRFFTTTNYEDFAFMPGNRTVSPLIVKKLSASIADEGQLNEIEVNPTKVNGKWVIIDGQHHFTVCKQLGIPVEVKVNKKDFSLRDLVTMNTVRKNWAIADVVASYASLGYPHYVRLNEVYLELKKKHGVSLLVLARLAHGTLAQSTSKHSKANLWDGSWEWKTDEATVRSVIEKCAKFKELRPNCLTDTFVICVFRLMKHDPQFKVKRLLSQAYKYPEKFIPASRKQDMMRMIEELYNWRKNSINRHYIDINL